MYDFRRKLPKVFLEPPKKVKKTSEVFLKPPTSAQKYLELHPMLFKVEGKPRDIHWYEKRREAAIFFGWFCENFRRF